MSRERVNDPDELRGGDRVEVEEDAGRFVVDLLFRTGDWHGHVVTAVAGAQGFYRGKLYPVRPGIRVSILRAAYEQGRVFIRRRSREDVQHQRIVESAR